jgi:hypothetical protein
MNRPDDCRPAIRTAFGFMGKLEDKDTEFMLQLIMRPSKQNEDRTCLRFAKRMVLRTSILPWNYGIIVDEEKA